MEDPSTRAERGKPFRAPEGPTHDSAAGAIDVPLQEVFLALAEEADDRHLRSASQRLADELNRGVAFSEAVANLRGRMPGHLLSVLQASADSGETAAVVEALARHESSRRRLRRELYSALLYPSIVVTLYLIVVALLSMSVVPQFAATFDEFGMETPVMTTLLVQASEMAPTLFCALLAAAAAYALISFIGRGRRLLHWVRSCLPILGPIATLSAQHEFASVLATLTQQRVVLGEALRCTIASLRDRNLARAAAIAASKCDAGCSLSQSLAESIHFDPSLPALVEWGESSNEVPQALRQAAHGYEEQIQLYTRLLRRSLPPILLALVAGTAFVYVSALLVPTVQMMQSLLM